MRRTVADWRSVVFQHRGISNGTRVLLLILADHMKRDGVVSQSRQQIARALGVTPRRITERVSEAHEAGLLDTLVHGKPGTTAVYKMLFPSHGADVRIMSKTAPCDGADVRTKLGRLHGADVGPATTYVRETSVKTSPQVTGQELTADDDDPLAKLSDDQKTGFWSYLKARGKASPRRWFESLPTNVKQDTVDDYLTTASPSLPSDDRYAQFADIQRYYADLEAQHQQQQIGAS